MAATPPDTSQELVINISADTKQQKPSTFERRKQKKEADVKRIKLTDGKVCIISMSSFSASKACKSATLGLSSAHTNQQAQKINK